LNATLLFVGEGDRRRRDVAGRSGSLIFLELRFFFKKQARRRRFFIQRCVNDDEGGGENEGEG
jgi:hypothetical protein